MKEITVVSTIHKENGAASSESLHEILENINPDVIFLETSSDGFVYYYKTRDRKNLESNAVIKYTEDRDIDLVPVDQIKADKSTFVKAQQLLGVIDANSTKEFQEKYDNNQTRVQFSGFAYLNSDEYSNNQIEINNEDLKTVQRLDHPQITNLHNWWVETQSLRENEMINQIYDYCRSNSFEKAVFLVGAAHRHSIINLSKKQNPLEFEKIKWHYYLS